MRISLNTKLALGNINPTNGYGYATQRMMASLKTLGHRINENDPGARVGIVFNQPHHARYFGNQYKILYHPWESTKLIDSPKHRNHLGQNWLEIMNSVDEVWTPSPLIAQWYQEYAGVTTPIYVYEHGVDSIWTPEHRKADDGKIKFLHIGGEAARKGWRESSQAFRFAFPEKRFKEVSLTFKVIKRPPVPALPGTSYIEQPLPIEKLVKLYHDHHVFLYPSWGEGFGLTPLQALATGMPTVTSRIWTPYSGFLDPNLTIGGAMTKSPWPAIHPGVMLKPDVDEIVDRLRYVYDNFDSSSEWAIANVPRVTEKYSWDDLTEQAFTALEKRLESH